MRRIISLVVVALVMAVMMLASALPVFAQASEKAGCVGQALSTAATTAPPGTVGFTISSGATTSPPGYVGQQFSDQTQAPREECPPLKTTSP
jgi:hypothetical protein